MVKGSNLLAVRSSRRELFCKKGVLENFPKFRKTHVQESLFLIKNLFIKKETLAQVFSSEFYEISNNTFFYRTLPVAASMLS